MTICLFGNYRKNYSRIQVLRQGLKQNNVRVLECHTRKTGFKKYLDLYQQHRKIKGTYDILIVAMGGQTLVWWARLLSGKKVVFDAFVSLYLTNAEDRKNCAPNGLRALYYKFWDWFPCVLADKVLLDTLAQVKYFSQEYKLKKDKFIRVLIGADNQIFYPCRPPVDKSNKFIIHWHGHIVPFHSVETIIRAAKILENKPEIQFQIITRFNAEYQKVRRLAEKLNLNNIKFYPETDYVGLAEYINQADICLGVFGNNKKAQLVIPNKIIEAIACAKPVITGRQNVLREVFKNEENIIMVKPEDPADVADKILQLKNNTEMKKKIGQAAYFLYLKELTPKNILQKLIPLINKN